MVFMVLAMADSKNDRMSNIKNVELYLQANNKLMSGLNG